MLGEMTQSNAGMETPNSDDNEPNRNESNNLTKRHLSAFEVSGIVEKRIKSVTELQAVA